MVFKSKVSRKFKNSNVFNFWAVLGNRKQAYRFSNVKYLQQDLIMKSKKDKIISGKNSIDRFIRRQVSVRIYKDSYNIKEGNG